MSRQQRRAQDRVRDKAQRRRARLATGALAAGALLAGTPAFAATITVNSLADTQVSGDLECTLREALYNANYDTEGSGGDCDPGSGADIITFAPSLTGTITLGGTALYIYDSVTINGPGADVLTIDGDAQSSIFSVGDGSPTVLDVNINNLTLTNGRSGGGGAVACYGENLTLDHVVITGNAASFGGGVYFNGYYYNDLTITNSTISGNTARTLGGGVSAYYVYGSIYLKNTTITGNKAGYSGGGVDVLFYSADGIFTMLNTVVSGNTSGRVPGAPGLGGGLSIAGVGDCGCEEATVLIEDSVISGNVGDPEDTADTGSDPADLGVGGGLYLANVSATIRRTTISGNTAAVGGGVFLYAYAEATFENVTIANNAAKNPYSPGEGGGVTIDYYASAVLNETTVTGNTAQTAGGGISARYGGIATLLNSIVANNTSGDGTTPDIQADYGVTATYTLIETPGSALILDGTGNITGVDPQLGPLADNGSTVVAGAPGFTQAPQTMLPECTSPVIDVGDPAFAAPPSTDERGRPRVVNGRIDMGAVEVGSSSSVQFSIAAQAVNETAGTVTVTVVRTGSDGAIAVTYATAPGTAKSTLSGVGTPDFTAAGGTLNWADGDSADKTFPVSITDDLVFEGDETFTAVLSAPVCATIGPTNPQTITILDNETQPTMSIGDVTKNEGNAGNTPFDFPVTLSNASTQTVTANYATAPDTAGSGDFTADAGKVTFNPGVTAQTVTIQVTGDTTPEPDETFTVTLSSPTNATFAKDVGIGTIVNDDPAADLSIVKIANGPFAANDQATYTITISNSGPNTATSVVVTDVLPAGVTFVSATPSQGSCSGTTTVTCNLGSLANGASATITLTVIPTMPGALSNTATVAGALVDVDPDNSTSTSDTTVAVAIPTLYGSLKVLLGTVMAALGLAALRRRSSREP